MAALAFVSRRISEDVMNLADTVAQMVSYNRCKIGIPRVILMQGHKNVNTTTLATERGCKIHSQGLQRLAAGQTFGG